MEPPKEFEGEDLSKITIEHFEYNPKEDLLGDGSYGEVYLCVSKKTKTKYAIKIVDVDRVTRAKMNKTLVVEETALSQLGKCHYIVDFFGCFESKDKKTKYFIMEYCSGGSFFDITKSGKKLDSKYVQFLAAELVTCIKYMKNNKIVHRDIKPENMLFDQKGFLKLIDFGTSKVMYKKKVIYNKEGLDDLRAKTISKNTFVGTSYYISPEIILDKKVSYETDLWALGVTIYKSLTGKYPFDSPSPYLLFQKIQRREMKFPSDLSSAAKDLIDKLLQIDQKDRLGSGKNGLKTLKEHEYFKGIDFKKLAKKELEAPKFDK